MWRIWLLVASLVVASSIATTQSMSADSKAVAHARVLLIMISIPIRTCYADWSLADALYRGGNIPQSQATFAEFSRCVENAPNAIKSEVDELRATLSKKPQALAAFKDYVLTYRALLAQLESRSTTLAEAAKFETILDGKAAKVIAEIEW